MTAVNHVIQHRKTEALFGLEYPAQGISFDDMSISTGLANSIPKRFERCEAVERLERFEPTLVGSRGIGFS